MFKPVSRTVHGLGRVPTSTLVSGALGLVAGLVVAVLISIPLFRLEGWMSWGVPLAVSASLGLLGLLIGVARSGDMPGVFQSNADGDQAGGAGQILIDTSAIIDGRIADLGLTGFIQGKLIIPSFILDELRHIADSSDSMRRTRGRRGLEVLAKLRRETSIPIQVVDVSLSPGSDVDGQLVRMAKSMDSPIMTTDFNLNRVAEVQGIQVLNVNDLANALRPSVLPGEDLTVNIVQEGKEIGQGVAFLDDGTMVVVDGGRRYINSLQDVTVTRVLQTAAGRIIFANPKAG